MEIIEVGKEAIILDKDELAKLRTLINYGVMNLSNNEEDDLRRFAEYFTMTTREL